MAPFCNNLDADSKFIFIPGSSDASKRISNSSPESSTKDATTCPVPLVLTAPADPITVKREYFRPRNSLPKSVPTKCPFAPVSIMSSTRCFDDMSFTDVLYADFLASLRFMSSSSTASRTDFFSPLPGDASSSLPVPLSESFSSVYSPRRRYTN